MRARLARFAVHPVQAINCAHFNRARPQHLGGLRLGKLVPPAFRNLAAQFDIGAKCVGIGHFGHRRIDVLKPVLRQLETGREIQDRHGAAILVFLTGNHPAIGKAAPVEIAFDAVFDRSAFAPTAQEIGVERMGDLAIGNARLRGLQGLRQHLSAKHAANPILLRRACIDIGGALFHRQKPD